MKHIDALIHKLNRPDITLSHQAKKVRKEMAIIMPKLATIQDQEILDKDELKDLAVETLDHAWSILQLQFILIRESQKEDNDVA